MDTDSTTTDNITAESRLITHASTLTGALTRTATLDGRAHLVVPVVALVAGVVNGMLVEAEELSKFPPAWNGRPVTLRHPQVGGEYTSANAPDIVERQVIGRFFNARVVDDSKLTGELWLDIEKCRSLGGDALVTLRKLEAKQPVEVSTAYFCDIIPAAGQYNSQSYAGIQRNLRPDHLALLPDEVGACSWRDGCGAPRINSEQSTDCNFLGREDEMEKTTEEQNEQVGIGEENLVANEEQVDESSAPSATETDRAPDGLIQLNELIQEVGGVEKLASLLRGLAANAESRRAELIGALAANSSCAFSSAELHEMPIEHLEKLHRSLMPGNYAGRPAVKSSTLADGEFLIGNEVFRAYREITQ